MLITQKKEFKALGTDVVIQLVYKEGENMVEALEALEKIENFYTEKEKIFSRFKEESELSRLNKNLNGFQSASRDIIEIAQKALFYYQLSSGLYDPRIIEVLEDSGYISDFKTSDLFQQRLKEGTYAFSEDLREDLKIENNKIFLQKRMDFSGIVKGYISDQVVLFLKNKGAKNVLVDSGGDIRVLGKDRWGENWKVSIENVPEDKMLFQLTSDYPSIATSGISRRKWEREGKLFHHLINPKKPGEFSFDLKTVTVIGKSTEEADFWAKVLFLMGKERGLEYSQENNIKSLFIDSRGNVYISSATRDNIINI